MPFDYTLHPEGAPRQRRDVERDERRLLRAYQEWDQAVEDVGRALAHLSECFRRLALALGGRDV
jgi:hypothetical protein